MAAIPAGAEVSWDFYSAGRKRVFSGTVINRQPSGDLKIRTEEGDYWELPDEQLTLIPPRDPVNHPPHYTKYPVEVIELTRHMSFGRGNAVKYIARAGLKSKETELEDLRKALFYIQDEITMLEGRA